MKMTTTLTILVILVSTAIFAQDTKDYLQLKDNKPLIGFYYFTHWWEPWASDDNLVLKDFADMKAMGYNAIFLDSEWSQMIAGDWKLLDRGHKLAKKAGIEILPWLSLKEWIDIASEDGGRQRLIKDMYGVTLEMGINAEGKEDRTKPYDPAVIEAGYQYSLSYLERYLENGAILHIMDKGKLKPVVAITVEMEWTGSNDPTTNKMFQDWLKKKYSYTSKLNKAWGTKIKSIDEIKLLDRNIFDTHAYLEGNAKYPKAVEANTMFRAEVQNNSMNEIKLRLKEKYPDLLIATELPYEFLGNHPHGISYTYQGAALPEATKYADILILRCTDSISQTSGDFIKKWKKENNQKIILAYRTPVGHAREFIKGNVSSEYFSIGKQAAEYADGFGFYSWNEMVDVHISADPTPPYSKTQAVTADEAKAWRAIVASQAKDYLENIK